MPTNRDVMLIVRMLDQEGFGALAGEILTEISVGRELDLDDGLDAEIVEPSAIFVESISSEARPRREPIPDEQQLGAAIDFLRSRLVQPVRYLAEAERIASNFLAAETEGREGASPGIAVSATRITFVNPDTTVSIGLLRTEVAGNRDTAERLDAVLDKITEQAV